MEPRRRSDCGTRDRRRAAHAARHATPDTGSATPAAALADERHRALRFRPSRFTSTASLSVSPPSEFAAMMPVLVANAMWLVLVGGFGVMFMIQAKADRAKGRNPGGDD